MATDEKADVKTPPKSETKDASKGAPKRWTENTAYRYVGPGIIPGVPNRDLTPFDVQRLAIDVHRAVAHSAFYQAIEPQKETE